MSSASHIKKLYKAGLLKSPSYASETVYEVIMGSVAYAVSSDTSDMDVYAVCIPPKTLVFPHLTGEIPGFGRQVKRFETFQQHKIPKPGDPRCTYDVAIYNIVKFFQLCMDNNPNMVDSLFVPRRCILHMTKIGEMIRDNRKLFLSKKAWHTFKGYSFSQMHKAITKNPEGKRREIVDKFGWDVKFGYHIVRLLHEVEQILTEGDLDLERSREQLKAIRAGEVPFARVKEYFEEKEKALEEVYHKSTAVPYSTDEEVIKRLLLSCLEEHYGSLDSCISTVSDDAVGTLREIKELITKKGF